MGRYLLPFTVYRHTIMRVLVATCLLAAVCHGQYVKPGPCPEFTTKVDFEVEPYLGKWYESARFDTPDEAGQTCNYAEYSDRGDGTVGVHNAGLDEEGQFTDISGYVETTDVPGALKLHLDGVPVAGNYDVLDTDYTTYTSVYSCTQALGYHIEQAWILTRDSAPTMDQLEVARQAFQKWGIDDEQFIATEQENCEF